MGATLLTSPIKLNLTDPCRTVPWHYHGWGMPGRRAGSPTVLQYNAESPKQGKKRFNSIVKTIYFSYPPIIFLFSPPSRGAVRWAAIFCSPLTPPPPHGTNISTADWTAFYRENLLQPTPRYGHIATSPLDTPKVIWQQRKHFLIN